METRNASCEMENHPSLEFYCLILSFLLDCEDCHFSKGLWGSQNCMRSRYCMRYFPTYYRGFLVFFLDHQNVYCDLFLFQRRMMSLLTDRLYRLNLLLTDSLRLISCFNHCYFLFYGLADLCSSLNLSLNINCISNRCLLQLRRWQISR